MSLHSDLAELAIEVAADINGESVTYRRPVDGGDDLCIVIPQAMRARAMVTTDEPGAAMARVAERYQNWIVPTDLLIDGNNEQLRPERGDEITDSKSKVFRVMPQTDNGPLWDYVDEEGQTQIRIHTTERS